ncbi:MAG: hypothetical protein PWP65_273 [Clostridia bacterium]|nr:hypothetical protein [Clostridia bacterium]
MSIWRCPGQDRRYWKPEDIFEAPCPHCGGLIEFWKDDVSLRCPHCRQMVTNPKFDPGCAAWCPYASKCIGETALIYQSQPQVLRDRLEVEVRKRLGKKHKDLLKISLKAAQFAEKIAREEGADPLAVIAACLLYQIDASGQREAGELADKKGTTQAAEIMEGLGIEPEIKKRIIDIIEHYFSGNLAGTEEKILAKAIDLAKEALGASTEETFPKKLDA